jgi:hypothetical protein
VLENKTYRDAGGKAGALDNPNDRTALVQLLISIDATT